MLDSGFLPNNFSFPFVLKACSKLLALKQVVASHVRCGLVDDAEEVFEAMPVRNVSSWTTMIGGFVQTGKSVEALALFHRMQMDGVKPDKMAVVTILSAIADLGVLDLGRWLHDYVEKNGIRIDAFVGCSN
ncbi:hypothetical protein AAC387_Pa02g0310 [Persea americana]